MGPEQVPVPVRVRVRALVRVQVRGDKVRDETGNRLEDLAVTIEIAFPEGEAGDAAREVLPSAVERSHDRLCTVSRTVERGTPVAVEVV